MKKQAAMIAICAALLICVATAGCTSSSSSPSPTASATAHSSTKVATAKATVKSTPTVTPTPTVTVTPTATPTPSASASPLGSTAGFTAIYFHELGCPYCAAFESTPSFVQLQNTGIVQSVLSTDTSTVQQYGVTSYPTVILLKNGVVVGTYPNPGDATAILAQINAG